MKTTIIKIDNELGMIIPPEVAEKLKLKEGSEIEVEVKGGLILISRVKRRYKKRPSDEEIQALFERCI